ncbi:disease resistance protein TAO1-like [Manihot esculenta]|nr:disease resistance protein TAO1-like [Manihot esculenta]
MINLRFLWITTRQKYFPTGGIGCLKSLRFLFITGCYNLEYLFEDMQGLKKLRRLVVWDCESLISLPQSIKCLTTLDTLSIAGCDNLELRMEEGEETQFSLQRLELRWLPKIVDFSEWLIRGSTNSLKVLEVKRCDNLRELPNCLQNMASHPEVRIIDCPELNNDPLQKAEEAGPSTSLS